MLRLRVLKPRRHFSLWPKSSPVVSQPPPVINHVDPTSVAPVETTMDTLVQSSLPPVDIVTKLPKLGDTLAEPTLSAITSIGDFATLGLCNNTPPGLVERMAELIHLSTGSVWPLTIVLTTVAFRMMVVFPQTIGVRENLRMQKLGPQLAPLREEAKRHLQNGNKLRAQHIHLQIKEKMNSSGVSYLRMGLSMVPVCILHLVRVANSFRFR